MSYIDESQASGMNHIIKLNKGN